MTFRVTHNPSLLTSRIQPAEKKAVTELGEQLLRAAQQAAPVEDGDLRRSGKVTVDGTTATVSFNTAYAARQHEDLTAKHTGGGAKYLEGPADELRRRALTTLATALGGAL